MYYVGIDIAKKQHEVCFVDQDGNILDGNSFKIPNTRSGVEKLEQMLNKYSITPENSLVGMESTGHYWLVLYSWLAERGYAVKVINAIVTDAYRHMLIRKTKTDRIDALVVAKVLMLGEYQESPIPPEDTLALRQLCRFRMWQTDVCSDLKRKAVALLDQVFPEYAKLFSNTFGMTSRELLKTYTTPEQIAAVNTRKLGNLLAAASHGRFGKDKALEIKAIAQTSLGISAAADAFGFQLRQILEQIEFVEQQIADLEQQIGDYMAKLESPIMSIPGIGPVYGAIILSEVGDIHRFPGAKQLVSYAGLDASVSQSGEFESNQLHMSKRGSHYLRRAIFGAAFIAAHSDPELSAYYQRLKARGKHHNVAIGAVARKLCFIIYAVLIENRMFESR